MDNPNPSRITAELWWFWEQFQKLEPTARLGGIFATKAGYHNTRAGNRASDYSVQSVVDRQGPATRSAGIDITFPDAQRGDYRTIIKYSARLLASGRDPNDERGNYLRSFFGNVDTDREVEGWDFQRVRPSTSDSSHLWHIHLSFSRATVGDMKAMRAVLSILAGEPVGAWRAREVGRIAGPTVQDATAAGARPATIEAGFALIGGNLIVGAPAIDTLEWTRIGKLAVTRAALLDERARLLALLATEMRI